MKYRIAGREKRLSFGTYPTVSASPSAPDAGRGARHSCCGQRSWSIKAGAKAKRTRPAP